MVAVRRFEQGFATDFISIRYFLARHGYDLVQMSPVGVAIAKGHGKPKRVHWSKVIDLVDRIRVEMGLEPIRRTT